VKIYPVSKIDNYMKKNHKLRCENEFTANTINFICKHIGTSFPRTINKRQFFIALVYLFVVSCEKDSSISYKKPDYIETRGGLILIPTTDQMKIIAKKNGVTLSDDDYAWLKYEEYRRLHGEIGGPGAPLAGGGIVGRDDWRTINFVGRPTAQQKARKLAREKLYLDEMPGRDPLADAKSAIEHGEFKLFFSDAASQPSPWQNYEPMKFRVIGLEPNFGCSIPENIMKKYAKRHWSSYYDVGYHFTSPKWVNNKLVGFKIELLSSQPIYDSQKYEYGYERKFNQYIFANYPNSNKFFKELKNNFQKCLGNFSVD
jgi:hypothetical protein